jgi:hypothetical protein
LFHTVGSAAASWISCTSNASLKKAGKTLQSRAVPSIR